MPHFLLLFLAVGSLSLLGCGNSKELTTAAEQDELQAYVAEHGSQTVFNEDDE